MFSGAYNDGPKPQYGAPAAPAAAKPFGGPAFGAPAAAKPFGGPAFGAPAAPRPFGAAGPKPQYGAPAQQGQDNNGGYRY